MKRLLLISYEFPPKGGTQAQHVAAMAMGLASRGWDVHVLTVADPPTSMIDEALAREVGRSVTVHRAFSLEPTRLIQVLRRLRPPRRSIAKRSGTGTRGFSSLPRGAIRAVQFFFVPDEKVGWTPWAVREGKALHSRLRFSALLAVGPPFTSLKIGRRLGRALRIPLLIDVRDPIVGGYFFTPHTPLHAAAFRRFERQVVAASGTVITATDGITEGIVDRVPTSAGRVHTIPNGFDRREFVGTVEQSPSCFTIAYVGSFQGSIRPDVFLAGAARAREKDPRLADGLRIRFVGALDTDTGEAIERTGLADAVTRTGFVEHGEAIREMRAADVLLMTLGPEPASAHIQTSKLPEYLASGRAILALVPDGVAAHVIRRSGAGVVVDPTSPDAAADAIAALYARWRDGTLPSADSAVIDEFDRTTLFARVDAWLREMVADG